MNFIVLFALELKHFAKKVSVVLRVAKGKLKQRKQLPGQNHPACTEHLGRRQIKTLFQELGSP